MSKPESAIMFQSLLERKDLRYDRKDSEWAKAQVKTSHGWTIDVVEPDMDAPIGSDRTHIIATRTLRTQEVEFRPIPIELQPDLKPALDARSDGLTVWVNDDARCIGRFSTFAAEVLAANGPPHYLDTPGKQKAPKWNDWVQALARFHNVTIDNSLRPQWSK